MGAAAIGAANVGAWTTGCDRGAAEAVTTGGDDTSVPSARAIGWRAITSTLVVSRMQTVHALGSFSVPATRLNPVDRAGVAGRAHGCAQGRAAGTAVVTF